MIDRKKIAKIILLAELTLNENEISKAQELASGALLDILQIKIPLVKGEDLAIRILGNPVNHEETKRLAASFLDSLSFKY